MRLAEIIVENYRGINDAVRIKIDDIVVLLGNNNVGKTTILNAYEAFASAGGSLSIKDFYNEDKNNMPVITGVFEGVVEEDGIAEKWIHKDEDLGYESCIKAQFVWDAPGKTGQKYSYDPSTGKYEKGGLGGIDQILANKIPAPLKISPLDDPAKLEGKILSILTEAIKENVKRDDSKINSLLEQIENLASDVQSEIEEDILASTQIVADDLNRIFPEFDHVEIDAKSGKIEPEKLINAGSFIRVGKKNYGPTDHNAPLSHQGTGLQRTFLWSCLKMLAETGRHKEGRKILAPEKSKILLIEEPEAFLHPHAINEAREALYAIADLENWQVMTTTHSPGFIDLTKDHTTIIRLEKSESTQHQIKSFSTDEAHFNVDDRENLKMLNFCNPYFNEFFFASYNVLVEGETEYSVIKSLVEQKDVHKPVHILNCFGKGNIVTVSKILNHFKVPYSIIHDSDNPTNLREGNPVKNGAWTNNYKIIEEVNKGLAKGNDINTFISIPNFEGEFLDNIKGRSKPYEAWKYFKEESENKKRFMGIINYIQGDSDTCELKYDKIEDVISRVENYIKVNGLKGDIYWDMSTVYEEIYQESEKQL